MLKKLKKKQSMAYMHSIVLITPIDLITLCELNFAHGKLPLHKVHWDDFSGLKPIYLPKLC